MLDNAYTIVMTIEGIFDHWWDYSAESKGVLRTLAALFDFELCACSTSRRPSQRRCTRNTCATRTACPKAWATSTVATSTSRRAWPTCWFRNHLDYPGSYGEVQALVTTFTKHYGLAGITAQAQRRNTSFGQASVELMRIANRYELEDGEQARVANLVRDIDSIIAVRPKTLRLKANEPELVQRSGA